MSALDPLPESMRAFETALAAGVYAYTVGRFDDAQTAFCGAARVAPQRPEPLNGLGMVAAMLGDHHAAATAYRQAIALAPGYPSAHSNLSALELDRGECAAALAYADTALAIAPEHIGALANRAHALFRLGQIDAADAAFTQALRVDPRHARTLLGQGAVCHLRGDDSGALSAYRAAQSVDPSLWQAKLGEAEVLLARGDWLNAWPLYEARLECFRATPSTSTSAPCWRGEPLAGRTIIVYAEQGLGDTMQLFRYVPLLAAQGADVILQVQPSLKRLLGRMTGARIVVARGDPLPPADFSIPLFSLPMRFSTTPASIPAAAQSLAPNKALMEQWKPRLDAASRGATRRFGIVWSGSAINTLNGFRLPPLASLEPLWAIPNTHWFALGHTHSPADRQSLSATSNVTLQDLDDFEDPAAIVSQLDGVISPCTAMAHLAGALGVPTWVMLAASADWRWLRNRDDSPWYQSVRLVRQTDLGDWSSVVKRVVSAIA